jgi:hypothetical protein
MIKTIILTILSWLIFFGIGYATAKLQGITIIIQEQEEITWGEK